MGGWNRRELERKRERERGGVIGRCGAAINRKKKNRLGCEMSLYFFGL